MGYRFFQLYDCFLARSFFQRKEAYFQYHDGRTCYDTFKVLLFSFRRSNSQIIFIPMQSDTVSFDLKTMRLQILR